MQSVSTTADPAVTPVSSLPERALVGLLVAVVANGLVRGVAGTVVDTAGIEPLGWGPILGATVVAALGSTAVYALVSRVSARPDYHFTIVAAVVLLLSMAPVFTVASTLPGVTTPVLAVLAVLHVTTAAGLVAGLTGVVGR
jgi:hypothetical protein